MAFKYTVVTDTMPWIGYNVLEQPQEVLSAVKEAGYDGIDLPGDPTRMDGSEWRKMTEDAGLEVPELLVVEELKLIIMVEEVEVDIIVVM